ncbi:PH domain-containing protein [Corynebacterium testudinoris]|uniref:Bacterial PH domain n=1 Tax=Corynebacterium testudinoris TaxID=136857 RepID=A0A0G3HAD1_9CORY|nr:Bacterial PH domain [Corynebacterium testudinoris]MBX8994918.1 PH domain-containing protein [Corynebacterium testudinoris]
MDAEKTTRTPLTDEDKALYNALDPHAVTTTKPWELEVRSRRLKLLAWVVVAVVMAVHIFMGAVLDVSFTGATVSFIDMFAFPIVGVVISILGFLAFTRPRLRANEDGVEVRNIVGTRFYPWVVIYGLSFPEGSRMARLELPEFEYVPIWAMQAGDGPSVVAAVSDFRELEAKYMPQD